MGIMSAIVLYVVIWTLVFFILNPLWQTSQSEDGHVVPGTPASAPVDAMVLRKAIIATVVATALFALVYAGLTTGWLSLERFDFLKLPSQR
jgi:predicted secreted protein